MRQIALWSPDWPVVAAAATAGADPAGPIAVSLAGQVQACSPAARDQGVRRGTKLRDAQARCPDLVVLPHDPLAEARAYEPVICALEELTPGIAILRPGLTVVRARGPARYFGSEEEAAHRLAEQVWALGFDCRAGVADGSFTAMLAARRAPGAQALVIASGQ